MMKTLTPGAAAPGVICVLLTAKDRSCKPQENFGIIIP